MEFETPHWNERYRLLGELGQGGMARVFRAKDLQLKRTVAFKVATDCTPERRARLRVEAQISAQLDHPAIATLYEFRDHDRYPAVAQKLIESPRTLAELIEGLRDGSAADAREWTFRRRIELIERVCQALGYAHARGVIHRDLKPQNILLGGLGEVYLLDWGVAKIDPSRATLKPLDVSPGHLAALEALDRGSVLGTPHYMCAQQLSGSPADPSHDVFALCLTLYEFLTLHHPLEDLKSNDPWALIARLEDYPPRAAETFKTPTHGRVPRALSNLVARGLDPEPERRYRSVAGLENALQRWTEGRIPITCPGTFMQRALCHWRDWVDQRPRLAPFLTLVAVGLLLLAVLALSGFYLTHR